MSKFAEHLKKYMGKKATVGYNAKPENLSEEMAIDLAEELDSAASLALEKAGLFWGGYSGEKERKERVEVAKEALKPLITNNFKKNIDGKFYDLVIEHLTDINSHIVVSAIEEIMKDKQASKCAKLNNKKANAYSDYKMIKLTNSEFVDLADSIKDVGGDEFWGIIYGKIVHVVAVIVFENKVLFETLINDEETQEIYHRATNANIAELELLPGDDSYADIGFVVKNSSNKLASIIKKEMKKSAGSIDYEVMMDIPQNSNVKKEDIIDEIQHLGDTYNLGLDDMYDFQPNHTITFTLPIEKANKLISELENLGFRLLRREKKDNRTQYEWERDQKIYD